MAVRDGLERCAACVVAGVSLVVLVWQYVPFWEKPLDSVDRERWARAWIDASNRRSRERIEPLLGDGARYTSPMTRHPLSVTKAMRHIASLWQRFPEGRLELRGVEGNRYEVVVEWVAYPESGSRALGIPGVTILTLHQGRLQWLETQYNAAALLPYFFAAR